MNCLYYCTAYKGGLWNEMSNYIPQSIPKSDQPFLYYLAFFIYLKKRKIFKKIY